MTTPCQFPDGREGTACEVCGYALKRNYERPPKRQCGIARHPEPGLGDYTERLLSSIGVTQERYVEAKAMFGLAASCDCAARKEWLNRVSRWWRGQSG